MSYRFETLLVLAGRQDQAIKYFDLATSSEVGTLKIQAYRLKETLAANKD